MNNAATFKAKTIRRSSVKKIEEIFSSARAGTMHAEHRGFEAFETRIDYIKSEFEDFKKAKLVQIGENSYDVVIHSNLWYSFLTK
tara:strand:- start:244 stop:498 length:255 start_codon:yes stop_codon:yes gene_type:complete